MYNFDYNPEYGSGLQSMYTAPTTQTQQTAYTAPTTQQTSTGGSSLWDIYNQGGWGTIAQAMPQFTSGLGLDYNNYLYQGDSTSGGNLESGNAMQETFMKEDLSKQLANMGFTFNRYKQDNGDTYLQALKNGTVYGDYLTNKANSSFDNFMQNGGALLPALMGTALFGVQGTGGLLGGLGGESGIGTLGGLEGSAVGGNLAPLEMVGTVSPTAMTPISQVGGLEGLMGGAGAAGAAAAGGATNPALIESAVGTPGYGASSAGVGGGPGVLAGAGATNPALIESAVGTPGYGNSSAGPGGASGTGGLPSMGDFTNQLLKLIGGLGAGTGGLSNLAGMWSANQARNDMKAIEDKMLSMYSQDGPYAQAMKQELDRRDAAAGRRSQYGPRAVELQAKLADSTSRSLATIYGMQDKDAQYRNQIVNNGLQALPGAVSSISDILKSVGNIPDWFKNLGGN